MTTNWNTSRENRWADSRRAEEQGDFAAALEIHKSILAEECVSYAANLRAGWLYYNLGAYEKSLEFYECACALAHNDWALYGMMNCLTALGDTDTLARVAETVYRSGNTEARSA